jgi:hypothetical protein
MNISGLSTWTSEWSETREFTRDDVLDHHRVVTEVFARVEACLPARFPTLVDSHKLEALVVKRYDNLLGRLEGVRGACELAITAVWTTLEEPTQISVDTSPGRRYLLERQHTLHASEWRRARASELADMLERDVEVAHDSRREVCPSPTVALSLALLVPRMTAEATKTRLPRTAPDVRILVNGPWPPYTFASVRSE